MAYLFPKDNNFLMFLILSMFAACGASGKPSSSQVSGKMAARGELTDTDADTGNKDIESLARDVALSFWQRLGKRDYANAAALTSFPFDMDTYPKCMMSRREMIYFFERQPLPPDISVVVTGAEIVAEDGVNLEDRWRERYVRWVKRGRCVQPEEADVQSVQRVMVMVRYNLNDSPGGALTSVRCIEGTCTVAGTDN